MAEEGPEEKGRNEHVRRFVASPAVESYLRAIQPAIDMGAMLEPVRAIAQQNMDLIAHQSGVRDLASGLLEPFYAAHAQQMEQWADDILAAVRPQIAAPIFDFSTMIDVLGFDPDDLVAAAPDFSRLLDLPTVARVEGFVTGAVRVMPDELDVGASSRETQSLRTTVPLLAALFVLIYPVMLDTIEADAEAAIRSAAWSVAVALLVLMLKGPGQPEA